MVANCAGSSRAIAGAEDGASIAAANFGSNAPKGPAETSPLSASNRPVAASESAIDSRS